MKILANENVYDPIIQFLRDEGHEVISVRESGMSGATDDAIYRRAELEGLTILTMDKDFSRMVRFRPDRCGGIIVVKIYRRTVDETVSIFRMHFGELGEERIAGRLVLMNPDGIRVRTFTG